MAENEKPTRRIKPMKQSLALAEIDGRLAKAISEKANAVKKVSELIFWQDTLNRLEQEINQLIGYQQRLQGSNVIDVPAFQTPAWQSPSPVEYAPFAGVPNSVGSIPARQPKAIAGLVPENIKSEGGFA